VTNLNAALKDYPAVAGMPLEEILAKLGELPESIRAAVRNNGGGHANHTMFWQPCDRFTVADITALVAIDFGSCFQYRPTSSRQSPRCRGRCAKSSDQI
jgi:Fe-Mn family superoxide dismutase